MRIDLMGEVPSGNQMWLLIKFWNKLLQFQLY